MVLIHIPHNVGFKPDYSIEENESKISILVYRSFSKSQIRLEKVKNIFANTIKHPVTWITSGVAIGLGVTAAVGSGLSVIAITTIAIAVIFGTVLLSAGLQTFIFFHSDVLNEVEQGMIGQTNTGTRSIYSHYSPCEKKITLSKSRPIYLLENSSSIIRSLIEETTLFKSETSEKKISIYSPTTKMPLLFPAKNSNASEIDAEEASVLLKALQESSTGVSIGDIQIDRIVQEEIIEEINRIFTLLEGQLEKTIESYGPKDEAVVNESFLEGMRWNIKEGVGSMKNWEKAPPSSLDACTEKELYALSYHVIHELSWLYCSLIQQTENQVSTSLKDAYQQKKLSIDDLNQGEKEIENWCHYSMNRLFPEKNRLTIKIRELTVQKKD